MNKLIYIFLLITFAGISATAQKKSEDLRNKQRALQKKINETKSLIGETKNNQRLTIAELGIINQQISYRGELIENLAHQEKNLEQRIAFNKAEIIRLDGEIKKLKDQYAKMIYYAYKNRQKSDNTLLYIFTSEDINKAYLRMKYSKQIADYRKLQIKLIEETQITLEEAQNELSEDKKAILAKRSEKTQEIKNFQSDKKNQEVALAELKASEQDLKNALDDHEKRKRQLALAIKKAIAAEVEKQNRNKGTSKDLSLTPEGKALSKSFTGNKGKLPWPVEKGRVTGKFGKNAHPVLHGVYTQNNGVDISTSKGATVRAVFSGTVSSVFVIPGAGKAIMISHGNYRTVYANLGDVYVKKGDKISTKQEIGSLISKPGENLSEAHFEIWRIANGKMDKQNPLYWLYPR